VLDGDGGAVGTFSVERSIAAGGGYTVGAYKYVFDEVAKAIVDYLKENTPK
jgi:hypothetical protein